MPGVVKPSPLHDATHLSKEERERIIKPFLPAARSPNSNPSQKWRRPHLRPYISLIIHKLIFHAVQLFFTLYIYARQTYHAIVSRVIGVLYYHHRSPELIQRDVGSLSRLPKHLSVIVDLKADDGGGAKTEGLTKLLEDVAELSAWCVCAHIPMLSIYERSGILKSHIPSIHSTLNRVLASYFTPSHLPSLHIRAPHQPAYSPPDSPTPTESDSQPASLNILLMSASDGRATLVDLTKTLAEMSQRGKLQPSDISSDLIDAELTESSCGEPDLLVLMTSTSFPSRSGKAKRRRHSAAVQREPLDYEPERDTYGMSETGGAGGDVCLRGYPPWQVRLTEIFHVQDSQGVQYQAFLRALYSYAKAEIRLGR